MHQVQIKNVNIRFALESTKFCALRRVVVGSFDFTLL